MMTSPIKLISTDFDGTLFAEFENPPVAAELQEWLSQLQSAGAKWVINTGRHMPGLMETLGRAGLSVEPDYLVLVEREIHVHQHSQYLALEPWNGECTQAHDALFARIRQDLPRLVEWVSSRFHAQLYEDAYSPFCLIASTNGEMDLIHAFLEEYSRGIPGLAVVRNDVYARFSHHDYNKGTALAELSRRLGISAAGVFAAGDHLNDLPMLSRQYAHMLAAPGNAVGAVKAAVRRQQGFVAERPHSAGIADAIKFYVERSSAGELNFINTK